MWKEKRKAAAAAALCDTLWTHRVSQSAPPGHLLDLYTPSPSTLLVHPHPLPCLSISFSCTSLTCSLVRKGNGEEVFSESFDVRRGVVQGDIFSPLCFIIALARVMELHDTKLQGDGLQLGHDDQQEGAYAKRIIRALLYADDAAILCKDEKEATVRLCSIQSASKESADMELSIPKTVCMHIHEADEVPRIEEEDIDRFSREGRLGQNCRCKDCGRRFTDLAALSAHQSAVLTVGKRDSRQRKVDACEGARRGVHKKQYEPEKVHVAHGQPHNRFYLVSWKGHDADVLTRTCPSRSSSSAWCIRRC
eukprot:COSAG04_NODE_846_length_9910_cov_10.499949_7_plen_307_part_00